MQAPQSLDSYSRKDEGRGMKSVEQEYKLTKIKAVVKMYQNPDPIMKLVLDFEEERSFLGKPVFDFRSLENGGRTWDRDTVSPLTASHPRHRWTRASSREVQRPTKELYERAIMWDYQGTGVTGQIISVLCGMTRRLVQRSVLTNWAECPTHTIAGIFGLHEQLLRSGNMVVRLFPSKSTRKGNVLNCCPRLYVH